MRFTDIVTSTAAYLYTELQTSACKTNDLEAKMQKKLFLLIKILKKFLFLLLIHIQSSSSKKINNAAYSKAYGKIVLVSDDDFNVLFSCF